MLHYDKAASLSKHLFLVLGATIGTNKQVFLAITWHHAVREVPLKLKFTSTSLPELSKPPEPLEDLCGKAKAAPENTNQKITNNRCIHVFVHLLNAYPTMYMYTELHMFVHIYTHMYISYMYTHTRVRPVPVQEQSLLESDNQVANQHSGQGEGTSTS